DRKLPGHRVSRAAVVQLDESCLGNGRGGENPRGAGGLTEERDPSRTRGRAGVLIEVRGRDRIERRDFYTHDHDTTNNRMALTGAIMALTLLAGKGRRLRVLMVSDSEY